MAYFSNFRKIRYDINGDGKHQIATHILQRVKMREDVKDNSDAFFEYLLTDGDAPEVVADKLYDSSGLHWINMLLNNTVNIYSDLPMNQDTFDRYLSDKYPGIALFLEDGFTGYFSDGDVVVGGNSGASGTVYHWDPSYNRMYLNDVSGTFEEDEEVASTNGSGTVARYVEDVKSALHHFTEDGLSESDIVNPRRDISSEDIDFDSNFLTAYLASAVLGDGAAVTNYSYEDYLNEQKRNHKILLSTYVGGIVNDIKLKLE